MVKVTYTDHERAAPYVKFHGVEFSHLVPVEIDEEQHAALLEDCRRHPWFAVEGDAANGKTVLPVEERATFVSPEEVEEFAAADEATLAKARKAGAQAYQEARDRKPPARFKDAQMLAWEQGYDEAREREDEARRRA